MNRQEWNLNHAVCPHCGSDQLKVSLLGVPEKDGHYEDNINTAACSCGWSGKNCERVPANTTEPAPMPIKLLDFNGETYANTKDTVIAIGDFNRKLNNSLTADDQRKFADAIFGEVMKMFVTIDKQHWVNKHNYQTELNAKLAKEAKEKLQAGSASKDETVVDDVNEGIDDGTIRKGESVD